MESSVLQDGEAKPGVSSKVAEAVVAVIETLNKERVTLMRAFRSPWIRGLSRLNDPERILGCELM